MASGSKFTYSFKNVGINQADLNLESNSSDSKFTPLGIKTPVAFSNDKRSLFVMQTNFAEQIKDNLRNLISTNKGERLMSTNFGANLAPLIYEIGTEGGDTEIMRRISETVQIYMPFIDLQGYDPIRIPGDDGEVNKTGIRISYSIPRINLNDQVLEVILFIAG